MDYIAFEKPIAQLEQKIDELRRMAASQAVNLDGEINTLVAKAAKMRKDMFANLKPYEVTQLARHPRRPNSLEICNSICEDFLELHGDRNFQDDKAIVGGLGIIGKHHVVMIGHQKGRTTKENIARNFAMPRPEGYRKALRLMSLAERFNRPIVTFIDTPGAYPGVGAEERGQSEAIAKNIFVMARLKVPIISIVIGEGGSGGALAIAVANRVYMLEHAIYSVISPEGCASILFKDAGRADAAASALQLTAKFAKSKGIIDGIIAEPEGGAHRSVDLTADAIRERLMADLDELTAVDGATLREMRMQKFLKMGSLQDASITNLNL